MSLLSRLREKQASKVATATAATFATQAGGESRTVAGVATVAVATARKPVPEARHAPQEKVWSGGGGTGIASRWWLIHYSNRDPLEVSCCPDATHAEILERHPDAIAAEPYVPTVRKPSTPLTKEEETAIRALLVNIGETDPATVEQVIDQCQQDADARKYFLSRWATLGA